VNGSVLATSFLGGGGGLSGVNANFLDGLDSTAFALAGHNHIGQSWSGSGFTALSVTNTASAAVNAVALRGVASAGASAAAHGVVGETKSPFGAGVWAIGDGTNTALRVSSGAIQVSGAGIGTSTAVFIHRATGANIEAGSTHRTTITHPMCDGDSNAILLVTPNYNPGQTGNVLDPHPIGVFYNSLLGKWQIFHQDYLLTSAPMATNAAFNVLIVKP
jgi:hypothetical protein